MSATEPHRFDGDPMCDDCRICGADPVSHAIQSEQPHRYGTPGRIDRNGVEWWACDPYPTWYRWVDGVLHTAGGNQLGGVHETPNFGVDHD